MKKFLTLIVALVATGCLNAQQLKRSWIDAAALARSAQKATIEPAANQAWWGYADGSEGLAGLGVTAADTYHCAIFIPGNQATAAGKTINAVRFGLVAPNANNVKVWIASSKPQTLDNVIDLISVPEEDLNSTKIDVALSKPYTIPSTGVYVGYTFTITKVVYQDDAYPVLTTGSDQANALLLRTEKNVPSWSDLNGQQFGSLYLQVLLEGEFADNQVTPSNLGDLYVKLGEEQSVGLTLTNKGITPISDIDYTIATDGVEGPEQHAVLTNPIVFNSKGTVDITITAEAEQCVKQKKLTVTKVNGNANEAASKTATFTLYSLSEIIDRNVVVEEYTGTGCGWCPRGLVGMEKLREQFGERFIGIGLHQYNNGDAMYIARTAYHNIGFSGAPECSIDRKGIIDPYYGYGADICNDFREFMAIPGLAGVNVRGFWNEDQTAVDATAEITPLFGESDYTLEFVLIGDGITGKGTAWNQSNYYYQYSSSSLPADLAMFGSGGKYGQSSISGWIFNDVALVSSYVNNKNQVPALNGLSAGTTVDVNYTLTLPTKEPLASAIVKKSVYVIALLINPDGTIANAAKALVVKPTPNAISDAAAQASKQQIVERFAPDGRRITGSQRGLNIVRTADGKTLKVMEK